MLHREYNSTSSINSVTEACDRMIDESNFTLKQIASRIGKTYSTLARELDKEDSGAKLGADLLLPLMLAATTNGGDSVPWPLMFLADQLGYRIVPVSVEPSSNDSRDEMLDDNHAVSSLHEAIRDGADLERIQVLASKAHQEIDETVERIRRERKGL